MNPAHRKLVTACAAALLSASALPFMDSPAHAQVGKAQRIVGAAVNLQQPNTLTEDEQAAGWKLLFDGKTTNGWRNYKGKGVKPAWVVEDGALKLTGKGGGDIMTEEQFDSFEFSIDYNITPKGNSGLIYHVIEHPKYGAPYIAPEIQIQDNAGGDPQKAGWLYQLYKPANDPATGKPIDATKPPGEWNTLRIVITPQKCEHYMNGVKYVEYVKGSKDWDERVKQSKFVKNEGWGKQTKGHIALQDHGNVVAFRNIKVRPIK